MKELIETLDYYYTAEVCTAETVEEQNKRLNKILKK